MKTNYQTIDEYIATFPADIQTILEQIRQVVHHVAPEASEAISYQMPTFKLNGNLVHFAAFKHHIGFYPTPQGIDEFKEELAKYKGAKGSVQFPLDQPMSYDLIERIVRFRLENLKAKQDTSGFPKLSQPALRALRQAGYERLEHLTQSSEAELSHLHGMGPKALASLKQALHEKGLDLKV
ncbi:MAG: DUF1801 domain-containing protein [Deinococcales bacterium]